MSLETCIDDLAKAGALTREQADHARDTFTRFRARRREALGPAAADAAATADTIAALEAQTAESRRVKLLQVDAQKRMIADIASFDGGKGEQSLGKAAIALLDHDGKAPYMNVAVQKQVIVGRAHAIMEGVLNRFSRDLIGNMRNPAEMMDVLRELFGKDSGNANAKDLAQAWTAAAEMLRGRFNAAGGAIGKLENWGLPQSHDGLKVREAGLDEWKSFITPLLDRGRMVDSVTGETLGDRELDAALDHVYGTVTTDGWLDRDIGTMGGKKLASQRAEHRFLHFRDAESWQVYHDRFGAGGTAFDVMVGHIDDMARDIAHLERLGPNPSASIKWLQDAVKKDAAITGRKDTLSSSTAGDVDMIGRLYDVTTGKTGMPVNSKWARGLSGARNWLTASKLGGALFSAFSDTGFQAVTRGFNGLPVTGALTDHLKLMASEGDRRAAIRAGLIAEDAARQAAGLQRYVGDSILPGVAQRLADGVLRVTGLSAWTQTGKWSYGMGEISAATGHADTAWGKLPDAYRDHLARYGIDAEGWDGIRSAERVELGGTDFIDPTRIESQALGDAFLRMIHTETAYAVPEVTARARALTTFGRAGTISGEFGRSALQFKSFGVSMILTHGRRVTSLSPWNAAAYAASLFVTTTLLGAFSLQAKEIAKGKGLRPMEDWRFWAQAAAQGSGFGIFGDLAQSQVIDQLSQKAGMQRFSSLPELLAGPLVGAAGDAVRLGIVAPAQDLMDWNSDDDYKAHFTHELVRDAKGYVPGANIWYTRAIFERLVLDNLQRQIDPRYARSWENMEQAAAKQGQQFWWHPGAVAPAGPPQVDNAFDSPPAS
ncbi:MAG: hypothetical protein ACTHOJ_17970 [Sphingomonas oligoaromativorans]